MQTQPAAFLADAYHVYELLNGCPLFNSLAEKSVLICCNC